MPVLDAIKSVAKSAGNDIIGNIETAYLVVHDYREAAKKAAGAGAEAAQQFTSMIANRVGGSSLSARTQALVASQAARLSNSAQAQAMQGAKPIDRKLKVQFNPSQIQLYSTSYPQQQANALGSKTQSVSNAVNKGRMELTVQLYFDDVNLADSFMWEKFTSGVSNQTVNNIATGVAKAGGQVWSVQPQVEGLISALRNPHTRTVSFHWADFAFEGQVVAVLAQYTMFSTSGRPVRAQVVLRLRHEMDDDKLSVWYDDFEKAFGEKSVNELAGAAQMVGSLMNLG